MELSKSQSTNTNGGNKENGEQRNEISEKFRYQLMINREKCKES